MTKDELIEFLRQYLRVEVDSTSVYTGSCDGPMYEKRMVVRLVLDGETISEVTA